VEQKMKVVEGCEWVVLTAPHTSLLRQVPVDIIERNIKRASESKADYAEIT